jgi:predicted extracellular nuclease
MVPQDSLVLLENVIASSGLTWSDDPEAMFYVQEPGGGAFSGIQIRVSNSAGLQVAAGDDVTIVGIYTEFFDLSQITIADASAVTVNGSGPSPAPELIADPATIATGGAMAEEFESVLVRVENVTVTNENPDAPEEYGEFEITGGLRVNDGFFSFDDWMKPAMGASYASITGLLSYSFSIRKLEPRDTADLVAN